MKKTKVSSGIFWVEIPEADLFILCGCPADSIKHLMKKGLISTEYKEGLLCETGPNAILLSDIPMQNERFANLSEFPVLQMLYRQGLILPNHPNNKGIKPMLIGIEEEVKAQMEYIHRGNYGLYSVDEITMTGIPENIAQEMMRIKLKFAFDNIRKTEALLDTRIASNEITELRNGVFIKRQGLNLYEFSYSGQTVTVDLNLAPKEEYEAPYHLEYYKIQRDYFSVIHTGEGDGWDINRPCMASILIYQGKIYLIDAGPNLLYSLQALGIGVSEIEGIFHTHAHDDHFNGLTILLRSDHKIKYYSTPLVRATVMKKLAALTLMDESHFERYFEIHDLDINTWNDIGGLEVRPVFSPHPVETCIMFFRTLWKDGYKTYAHLADISSFDVLKSMITNDPSQNGISSEYYKKITEEYLTPVSLKKIDTGGGMIHGKPEDFQNDASEKIILSHTAVPHTDRQKEIGENAAFGAVDVLIPANWDYSIPLSFHSFQEYFPQVPPNEIYMLLNCPTVSFNPGAIIIRKGEINTDVFFALSGLLEYIVSDLGINNKLTAGSIVGELSCLMENESRGTYRAVSYVKALQIPCYLYTEFLKRNGILDSVKKGIRKRGYLMNTWLFGERISCPLKNKIAQNMKLEIYDRGEYLPFGVNSGLFLLNEGELSILLSNKQIDFIKPGGFYGEEEIIFKCAGLFRARAKEPSKVYHIPASVIEDIPIVQYKMLEVFQKRLRTLYE